MRATANSEPESYEARESRTRHRNAKPDFLPSSRYSRRPRSIYRFHLGHISTSSPLYALSFISCAFHNPPLLLACERTVLTPVQSVSSTRCGSNGRLDTFSFLNPLWSHRAELRIQDPYERIERPPCRGQGVGQLASDGCAICTTEEPLLFLGRTTRETERKMREREREDRGVAEERLAASLCARGLADNVAAANIAYCPSSMAVCPAPLSLMISERFACVRVHVHVCSYLCGATVFALQ